MRYRKVLCVGNRAKQIKENPCQNNICEEIDDSEWNGHNSLDAEVATTVRVMHGNDVVDICVQRRGAVEDDDHDHAYEIYLVLPSRYERGSDNMNAFYKKYVSI